MCFTYDVKVIVMLCKLFENYKEKCANYWEKDLKNFKIEKINYDIEIDKGLKIRNFKIINKNNGIVKKVIQIHLTNWDDHTAPISIYSQIIKIIDLVDKYRGSSPVTLHCSAGVGRTGTFLSIYNLYHEIIEQLGNINLNEIRFSIMNLVRKLKEMRLYLVENEKQYIFLYQFVNKLLHQKNC